MEPHKNSAFAKNDPFKTYDNMIQKSKFLKDAQIKWLTQLNRRENSLNEEEDECTLRESEASFLHKNEVKWSCRKTVTNFYLFRMTCIRNPTEEQAIRPLNTMLKSHSFSGSDGDGRVNCSL